MTNHLQVFSNISQVNPVNPHRATFRPLARYCLSSLRHSTLCAAQETASEIEMQSSCAHFWDWLIGVLITPRRFGDTFSRDDLADIACLEICELVFHLD